MEIWAGSGQVVASGEQVRQIITDAGSKVVPQASELATGSWTSAVMKWPRSCIP